MCENEYVTRTISLPQAWAVGKEAFWGLFSVLLNKFLFARRDSESEMKKLDCNSA